MKKLLAIAIVAAITFYLGNQFMDIHVQAEMEQPPQAEENVIELYGKIKASNGNEIVVAVGKLPSSGGNGMNPAPGNSGGEIPAGDSPSGGPPPLEQGGPPSGTQPDNNNQAQSERPSNAVGDTASAGNSGASRGAQDSGSGQMSRSGQGGGASMRAGMTVASVSLELTGEEETFLIPVTAKITTGSGDNERTVRFTQLAYKNIIKLTLNENGGVTAINILS